MWVKGKVIKVIDGDTFDMTVTHVGKNNKYEYNDNERIRMSGFDAPELNTAQGQLDKEKLEKILLNMTVRVSINARDSYHRIVGSVEIVK